MKKTHVNWSDVYRFIDTLPAGAAYGVPRGGAVLVGIAVAKRSDVISVRSPELADYIVDDVVDSGKTRARFGDAAFIAMHDKTKDRELGWVVYPWEHRDELQDNEDTVVRQLELLGEDPTREGLRDTPRRYLKAMREMTQGYALEAEKVLSTVFAADGYDDVVVCKNIEFTSLCEHHMLPFIGRADVAYLPGDKIVGLSKLARLVDMHARRLQVQERMTHDIAEDLQRILSPKGVAVVVEAHHACMGCRGVKKPTARMVTSAMRGAFMEKPAARAEVLGLFERSK